MTKRAERVVVYQFAKAEFFRGSWLNLLIERPNGKLKRVKGLLLNTPRLLIQKSNLEIVDIPVSRIVKVEGCLPPWEAKKRMLKERAYRLAKEIRKRERLIARYDAFLFSRLRKKGRLPD